MATEQRVMTPTASTADEGTAARTPERRLVQPHSPSSDVAKVATDADTRTPPSSGAASSDTSSEKSPRTGEQVRRCLDEEFQGPVRDLAQGLLVNARDVEAQAMAPEAQQRVYWESFFVVSSLFMGYASLFGLQHFVKESYGIKDNSSKLSHQFGVAVSFLYIFNLIFRFAHNVVFGWLSPRARVVVSMSFMMLSMLTIAVMIMVMKSQDLIWVYVAYAFGGVAVGSFESNLLSSLTPLGHGTKHVAILGIPVGVTSVLVGLFFVLGPPLNVPVTYVYVIVAGFNLLGIFLFLLRIPSVPMMPGVEVKGQIGLRKFASDIRKFRQWLPMVWHYPLATAVNMFTLSCFSPGVALFIYNQKTVEVIPGQWTMATTTFFACYNITNMLGGLWGRWLSYRTAPRHPLVYTIFNIVGVVLLLTKVPLLAPLSTLLVMFGDGMIYGTISRHVDVAVPKEFNLIAISYWLFVGDFGSVLGSNMISYVRDWVVGN